MIRKNNRQKHKQFSSRSCKQNMALLVTFCCYHELPQPKVTYRRKSLFGLWFQRGESSSCQGIVAADSRCGGRNSLRVNLEWCVTLKPPVLPPTRPSLPKHLHQLGTDYLNARVWGHFHSHSHTVLHSVIALGVLPTRNDTAYLIIT